LLPKNLGKFGSRHNFKQILTATLPRAIALLEAGEKIIEIPGV
jgi:hypothetical protein